MHTFILRWPKNWRFVVSSYFSVANTRADRKPGECVEKKWVLREKKIDKVNNKSRACLFVARVHVVKNKTPKCPVKVDLELGERKIELRRQLNNTFVTAYSNALATHGNVTLISLSSLHNVDNGIEMMERGSHFLNHLCRCSSGSTHATLRRWIIAFYTCLNE